MHAPIEDHLMENMNTLARALDEILGGAGFALLVFELNSPEGRMNYISNARREDMLVAMKEFVANMEGRGLDMPEKLQ